MKIKITKNFVKKIIVPLLVCGLTLAVLLTSSVLLVSSAMVRDTEKYIKTEEQADKLYNIDCIIVLGAFVRTDGTPSDMLRDRLDVAIALYKMGISDRILMSGDHGSVGYNEVGIMKKYALEQGVQEEHIFMDHAGFSTYETMYRARDIFEVKRAVVVTQKYHIYRALYICKNLGIEAVGVNSDPREYAGQGYRNFREVLARTKDFFNVIIEPKPTFLGETIPVNGNGDITNDKN